MTDSFWKLGVVAAMCSLFALGVVVGAVNGRSDVRDRNIELGQKVLRSDLIGEQSQFRHELMLLRRRVDALEDEVTPEDD